MKIKVVSHKCLIGIALSLIPFAAGAREQSANVSGANECIVTRTISGAFEGSADKSASHSCVGFVDYSSGARGKSALDATGTVTVNLRAQAKNKIAVRVNPEASTGSGARTTGDFSESTKQNDEPWWKNTVIYEIYPRSFADSKNSGMGDIKGITGKLDYLADLGVGALWLTPCYPSPQVDFGYDISDYCAIAPEYGTMEDFDELVREARKRGIRIIMDLVMNHTSDKHPWFVESSSSRNNPKRDWYIWRDGKDKEHPPNNWQALFGHSAWQWDEKTKQFYYHFFYPEQPDLNWRNATVKNAMFDVVRFWLDKGVAGFRLDAINTLFEDPDLKDNPIKAGKNAYGDPNMENKYNYLLLPEIHATLRDLRSVLNKYSDHPVLLGETTAEDISRLVSMYGEHDDEIQLPMDFRFAYVDKLSAPLFRERIAEIENNSANGWPTLLYSNHDRTRHYDRYAAEFKKDEHTKERIAKMLAAMLLCLRGTPVMYYGEEIGMENRDPRTLDEVQDPIGKIGWPGEKGRDGERTPMQWSSGLNAGFSKAKPWLPVAENYRTHNVAVESKDPQSVLNFYKSLLSLRKSEPALRDGAYRSLLPEDPNVLCFARDTGKEHVIVLLNMSSNKQSVGFAESEGQSATVLLSSNAEINGSIKLKGISLEPLDAVILKTVQ